MAIKTYRPITPTLRFQTSLTTDDLTTDDAAQAAADDAQAHGRTPQLGRSDHPPSGRRAQAEAAR
jgi:ribosomal protein L2